MRHAKSGVNSVGVHRKTETQQSPGCTGLGTVSIGICIARENVRHNGKNTCATTKKHPWESMGIYGNLWESMGSLEKTSQCYGNPLLRTTEIPNIRYCVPLKSLISVTAYH